MRAARSNLKVFEDPLRPEFGKCTLTRQLGYVLQYTGRARCGPRAASVATLSASRDFANVRLHIPRLVHFGNDFAIALLGLDPPNNATPERVGLFGPFWGKWEVRQVLHPKHASKTLLNRGTRITPVVLRIPSKSTVNPMICFDNGFEGFVGNHQDSG